MKKIILFGILFSLLISYSPIAVANTNIEDLSILQMILEEVKVLRERLIERELAMSVFKMKVIMPNGSDVVKAGQYLDIKWDTSSAGVSKINIYLTTDADIGNKKEPGYLIARDVPVEMPFYHWLVPNNLAGNGYKIFIRNNGKDYRLGDYSDAYFNILPADTTQTNITLNSPKGGELYFAGRTYSIHWNMPKFGDKYATIKLIRGNEDFPGADYIETNLDEHILSSQGSLEWVIPKSIPSGDYKLVIVGLPDLYQDATQSSNVSISGIFKIIQSEDLPNQVILLSPPPVTEILAGQSQVVSWLSPFDMDRMDIFLRGLPSGRNYPIGNGIESKKPTDDNKMVWIPKDTYGDDEKYTIRVCSSGTGNCGESIMPFSIVPEKTPELIGPQLPFSEPDNPQYDKLKEIVGSISQIVSSENSTVFGSEVQSVEMTQSVADIDYSSPKQNGYLPYNFNTRLSVGLIDSDAVRALQEALIREGLFNHSITGRFFSITEAAVKQFQTKYGLDPSGSVGPGTQRKLNELYSVITESID